MSDPLNTTQSRRALPPVETRRWVLRVVYSADRSAVGRALPLDGRRHQIGRSGTSDAAFDDERMSRDHFSVAVHPSSGAYAVEDLGSRNGTFVDGAVAQGAIPVAPNQVISAGDTLCVVDEEPDLDDFPSAVDADADVPEIVGQSFTTLALRRSIATIAGARGSVLVLGRTGVGKEVTAQALHRLSGRPGPIVSVNCATIPADLAEAELFGYRRGAFSGAEVDRAGFFVEADRGTLFLDELGDLPPALQPKLLRVLEDRRVQPLGGGAPVPVDVRLVAATHADLDPDAFRRDLLARIAQWVVRIPPLCLRRADILALFEHFAPDVDYSAELAEALLLHEWPTNVRELRNLVGRLETTARPNDPWDLPLLPGVLQRRVRSRAAPDGGGPDRASLEEILVRTKGNVSQAAELLGKDRKSVYRWMRRLAIDPKRYR